MNAIPHNNNEELDRILKACITSHRSAQLLLDRGHYSDAVIIMDSLHFNIERLEIVVGPIESEWPVLDDPFARNRAYKKIIFALAKKYITNIREKSSNRTRLNYCAVIIISLLSLSCLIYSQYRNYTAPARQVEETRKTLIELAALFLKAKQQSGKTLLELTGNSCSECPCKGGRILKGVQRDDQCMANWLSALRIAYPLALGQQLEDERGKLLAPPLFLRDAWGNPYALNENEGEIKGAYDELRSPGPDGILYTDDDIGARIDNLHREPNASHLKP